MILKIHVWMCISVCQQVQKLNLHWRDLPAKFFFAPMHFIGQEKVQDTFLARRLGQKVPPKQNFGAKWLRDPTTRSASRSTTNCNECPSWRGSFDILRQIAIFGHYWFKSKKARKSTLCHFKPEELDWNKKTYYFYGAVPLMALITNETYIHFPRISLFSSKIYNNAYEDIFFFYHY